MLLMKYGLLLTPEDLVVPRNKDNPTYSRIPQRKMEQVRASVTLVERSELAEPRLGRIGLDVGNQRTSHFEEFGDFAVGIDPIEGRRLGAVPVIYFYERKEGVSIPVEILRTLFELRFIAMTLARLEAKARPGDPKVYSEQILDAIGFVLDEQPGIRQRVEEVTGQDAGVIVDLLDTERRPAWSIVDLIDAMFCFIQTADEPDSPGSLLYYQQREWRFTRIFGSRMKCYRLGPRSELDRDGRMPMNVQEELRSELKSVDERYFTDEKINSSTVLHGVGWKHFFEFVEEVICPCEAKSEVASLLQRYLQRKGEENFRFRDFDFAEGHVVFIKEER